MGDCAGPRPAHAVPERDPSITPRCAACGSDAVIPDVAPSLGGAYTIKVALDTRPGVRFKRGKDVVTSSGRARVCGDCGYIMMYADDPRALWDGYVERLSRQTD